MINRILIFLLLLTGLSASAQIAPLQDTVPSSKSKPIVPTFRQDIVNGQRINYIYNPLTGKYDALLPANYIRKYISGTGSTTDTTSLSNRINSKADKKQDIKYLIDFTKGSLPSNIYFQNPQNTPISFANGLTTISGQRADFGTGLYHVIPSGLKTIKQEIVVVLNNPGGIFLGNDNGGINYRAYIPFGTGNNITSYTNRSLTPKQVGAQSFYYLTGDSVKITQEWNVDRITTTLTNLSRATYIISDTYIYPLQDTKLNGENIPQIGNLVVGQFDGYLQLKSWKIYKGLTRSNVVFLGNSLSTGYNQVSTSQTYAGLLNAPVIGSPGGTTTDFLSALPELYSMQPKYVILEGGVNDASKGFTTDLFISNMKKLVDSSRSHGITPIILNVFPVAAIRDSVDAYNRALKNRFPNVKIIDANAALSGSGGGNYYPTYVSSDNVHINEVGSLQLARYIYSQTDGVFDKVNLYDMDRWFSGNVFAMNGIYYGKQISIGVDDNPNTTPITMSPIYISPTSIPAVTAGARAYIGLNNPGYNAVKLLLNTRNPYDLVLQSYDNSGTATLYSDKNLFLDTVANYTHVPQYRSNSSLDLGQGGLFKNGMDISVADADNLGIATTGVGYKILINKNTGLVTVLNQFAAQRGLFSGLVKYAGDYSGSFDDFTLINKGYADGRYSTAMVNILIPGSTTLSSSGSYTYSGTGGDTFSLQSINDHSGDTFFIKNAGSGPLTIMAYPSENNLFLLGVNQSATIAPGFYMQIKLTNNVWYATMFRGLDKSGNQVGSNAIIMADNTRIEKSPNGTWYWVHSDDDGTRLQTQVSVTIDSSNNATIIFP